MKAHSFTTWLVAGLAIIAVAALTTQQVQEVSWTRTIGGTGFDHCYSVRATSDGGYVLGGWTTSSGAGQEDLALAKTDDQGKLLWQRTYGGEQDEFGQCICKTTDGGYALVGYTQSFGAGDYDVYLVKVDADGRQQWQKTYGGKDYDIGNSVQQTTDGGFILTGNTRSFGQQCQIYLLKTDQQGNVEWEKTLGGAEDDYGQCVRQTAEGGYLLGGDSNSGTKNLYDFDMLMVKTDARGEVQWQRTFGGERSDGCYSVQQTSDGGYILAGDTESLGQEGFDMYLVKTDARGFQQWWKTYGGDGWDDCQAVQQTRDGGYILAGYSNSFGDGDQQAYIVKVNQYGLQEWQKLLGGADDDYAYSVCQTDERHFVVAGYTESYGQGYDDMWLVQLQRYIEPQLANSTQHANFEVRLPWGILTMFFNLK